VNMENLKFYDPSMLDQEVVGIFIDTERGGGESVLSTFYHF
jgi:hypothetical protein